MASAPSMAELRPVAILRTPFAEKFGVQIINYFGSNEGAALGDSVFLLVLLLIVSRVFVALRVVVRGSFYVQTTRALQGATAPR